MDGSASWMTRVKARWPRIEIRPRPTDSAALRVLTRICPGSCFSFDAADRIAFSGESCTLCGLCRTVCKGTGEVVWLPALSPAPPEGAFR